MSALRVGLVLGAGGVVGGAFHAGVLSALAEATGWDPRSAELIVGTSAGSLTGAFLRAGLAASDLSAGGRATPRAPGGARLRARRGPGPPPPSVDLAGVGGRAAAPGALLWAGLRPWRVRPGAVVAALMPEGRMPSDPIRALIDPLFAGGWSPAPFWVCAVRLSDARRVVFGRGDGAHASVGQAVAASCAIPGVFAPVPIGGARYVDGGAHSPTNLDAVRREKLDLVVVSSPMSAAGRGWRLSADLPFRQLCRAQLAREAAAERRRGTHVITFQPSVEDQSVMGLNPMDPARRGPVTARVLETTLRRLERLEQRGLLRGL